MSYHERHQSRQEAHSTETFCTACGTILFRTPPQGMLFTQLEGDCTCNWGCCETALPANQPHARHLASRRSSVEVTEWTRVKETK